MKKTVLHVADFSAPYAGNFIASLLSLGETLGKAGLKQILMFPIDATYRPWFLDLKANNIPVDLIDTNLSLLNMAKKIAKISKIERVTIIHTHFTRYDVPSSLARIMMQFNEVTPKIIWHIHSNFPIKKTFIRKIKDILKFKVIGKNSHIIVVSDELKQLMICRGFNGKIDVVHNGVDINRATNTNRTKTDLRKEFCIPDGCKVFLSFGWEPKTKGVDLTINAFEKLNKYNFILLIVGTGKLKEFIHNKFGKSLPSWLKIAEPRESVAEFYRLADIFVSASRWEGWPYSVGEAMANGLPVISSNIQALKWAHNSKGVFFFDLYHPDDFKKQILKLLDSDSRELQEISTCNVEFIRKNYSIEIWTNKILNIYQTLI